MLRERLDIFFTSLWDKFRRESHGPVPSSSPAWETWGLDPEFLTALSQWTRKHPEDTLERILGKICAAIDGGKDLIELVPDGPFPARGLVKVLIHVVRLGASIPKASRDVQAFAVDIARWVDEVGVAFRKGGGGRFTLKTWENLAEMRALIDEICGWAKARLEDGRWSRIGHALLIEGEINEFNARIAKARAFFMDLSIINISQGHDAIFQSVRQLIALIQQTQAVQLSSIIDELEEQKQQKETEARRQFLSQMLSKHAITNTAYDEQGKRPCDSDTRVDILADIKKWAWDVSGDSQSFLWLTGDPGSGKSAITASFARECKDDGILWAQFFINRNIGSTTNPASYFPSIARQLADHSPEVALAMHDALKKQPSLMDDISQPQAGELFVNSLKVASAGDPSKPVVVIIDGLDETDTTRLRFTADIFSKALIDLPRNVKVFISSRTEDDIRTPFSATLHTDRVKHVHLDTAAESSIRDVSAFLKRGIADIANRYHLNLSEWPGEERMTGLCGQASGLFIWAVTTMKFIQDQVEEWGSECLNDVLDELNVKSMGDINVLYNTILRITHRDHSDPWTFERFRRMVGCIVVLQEPLCLADIKSLLDLRKTTSSAPVDIERFIRRFRTVLVAGTDAIDGRTIPRLHKSFFEFITSERADPRFHIDMDKSNGEVAMQCLRQIAGFSDKYTTATNDAQRNQSKGLARSKLSGSSQKFVTAVTNSTPHLSSTTGKDEGCFSASLRYAVRFWTRHLPREEAVMAGVVLKGSHTLPELQELIESLSFHGAQPSSANIASLADGKQMVTSWGDTVRVWDTASVQHTRLPFEGHTRYVLSVAFSPDGKQVVSGSRDHTIRRWDAGSGQPLGQPLEGHTKDVNLVAFSPDGK